MSVKSVVAAIESVLPPRRPIHHHEPFVAGKEYAYVNECLSKGVAGDYWVKKLEAALADYCGVEQAVGVSSGTAALHVALLAIGVKPDEEVIVPALTFAATANAVKYVGAVPHFVDGTVGINAFKLRGYLQHQTKPNPNGKGRLNPKTDRVISALIVVDLLGYPANMTTLSEVAGAFGLLMIEDASQALGATHGNRRCGSFGDVATFSFNNNKIVTGNGGGAVLTNNAWIAAKVHQLATTARVPHPWLVEHDDIGYNYRLQNINAALALGQFEQLDSFLTAKKSIHAKYQQAFAGCEEGNLITAMGTPNYWLTTFLLGPKYVKLRDELLQALHDKGVLARALFTPLHRLKPFLDCPRDPNLLYAEDTFARAICLPSGAGLA